MRKIILSTEYDGNVRATVLTALKERKQKIEKKKLRLKKDREKDVLLAKLEVETFKDARARLFSTSISGPRAVDVHTHMYTPRYMDILKKRTDIPRVIELSRNDFRLVILPGEDKEETTNIGRPIGAEYWDVQEKLRFMDLHGIEKSVISLANPWLDFLEGEEAANVAQELNDELQGICERSSGRLFGFAVLPVRNPPAALRELRRLRSARSTIKGVILGTPGAGKGLDDPALRDMLQLIAEEQLTVFLHPHYGVGNEHFRNTGHALFLALGFPMETTVCVSRLIVTGVLDDVPKLRLLVAHAGAALPALIGRLDSSISNRLQQEPSAYLRSHMFFDAISYSATSLRALIEIAGPDKIMFAVHVRDSAVKVLSTIEVLPDAETRAALLRGNAHRILGI
eukprot:gene29852-39016_t